MSKKETTDKSKQESQRVGRGRSIPCEMINPQNNDMTVLCQFSSCADAARLLNINRKRIGKVCHRGGGLVEGYYFRFVEPNTNGPAAAAAATDDCTMEKEKSQIQSGTVISVSLRHDIRVKVKIKFVDNSSNNDSLPQEETTTQQKRRLPTTRNPKIVTGLKKKCPSSTTTAQQDETIPEIDGIDDDSPHNTPTSSPHLDPRVLSLPSPPPNHFIRPCNDDYTMRGIVSHHPFYNRHGDIFGRDDEEVAIRRQRVFSVYSFL